MVTNWEDQVDGLVDDIETVRKHTIHRKVIAVAGPLLPVKQRWLGH